jgi:hypothetical protein
MRVLIRPALSLCAPRPWYPGIHNFPCCGGTVGFITGLARLTRSSFIGYEEPASPALIFGLAPIMRSTRIKPSPSRAGLSLYRANTARPFSFGHSPGPLPIVSGSPTRCLSSIDILFLIHLTNLVCKFVSGKELGELQRPVAH